MNLSFQKTLLVATSMRRTGEPVCPNTHPRQTHNARVCERKALWKGHLSAADLSARTQLECVATAGVMGAVLCPGSAMSQKMSTALNSAEDEIIPSRHKSLTAACPLSALLQLRHGTQ